jgi:8-amino-7-oxononanoate synthase
MNKIESLYAKFLAQHENLGLRRYLTDISLANPREIEVNGRSYLNFSSNDYLGLRHHPELVSRARLWAESYGAGSGASRLVTGNLEIFSKIENKIAAFKHKQAALIMGSGFQANASILPALFDSKILDKSPLVFSDKLNHASMHLGCNAAGIQQIRYRHNDMNHLLELLQKHANDTAPKFILTESVFSMDGDIAPLAEMQALARKYDCFTIVDEAHATSVLGENGRGLAVEADLIIGTFSKGFGSFGAYIACSATLKEYLINKCSGLIYATALPPAILGSIDAALDLAPTMNKERTHLQKIAQIFRDEMLNTGFDCAGSKTQIVPVIIGQANEALFLSEQLRQSGIWATAIRPPTVPPNTARLRFAFSAAHTNNDLDKLIDTLKKLKHLKVA